MPRRLDLTNPKDREAYEKGWEGVEFLRPLPGESSKDWNERLDRMEKEQPELFQSLRQPPPKS